MTDNKDMFSVIAVFAVFGANAVLSSRYGADSRRPSDHPNW
jgi:hypothetical protein